MKAALLIVLIFYDEDSEQNNPKHILMFITATQFLFCCSKII
jgi:hypothetical protein